MNFHNYELSYFCREDPELVEALDIEEAGGDEEDYWANTVILQQTFYPFFRLNVIIDILSLSYDLYILSNKVRFREVKIDGVKNVPLVPLLGQRLR